MCDRCDEIQRKATGYQKLLSQITDAQVIEGMTRLLAELREEQARLHPDAPPPATT